MPRTRGLSLVVLPSPPHGEKLHLDLGVAIGGVLGELVDDGGESLVHVGILDLVVGTDVVLVYGFEPAYIIVAVGDQVDVEGLLVGLGLPVEVILALVEGNSGQGK